MSIFLPKERYNRITDIPINYFNKRNIETVVLDIDNTLTTHDNPKPMEGVEQWLEDVKETKVKFVILSNNNSLRVYPFAEKLGLFCVTDAKKPLKGQFKKAYKMVNGCAKTTAAIGDQIFTDIVGANLDHVYSILVNPIELEKTKFFKFKRAMEKPFLRKFEKKNEKYRKATNMFNY